MPAPIPIRHQAGRLATRLRTIAFLGLHGYRAKVDLAGSLNDNYGAHRSGWIAALAALTPFHHPSGVLVDPFIERTFSPHRVESPEPHRQPWIGFIHTPPDVPSWFMHELSNEEIFASRAWQESLPSCRGLITLSNYHRKALDAELHVPVESLVLPTDTPRLKWSWSRFTATEDRSIVQVGWWLRRLHSIHRLPTTSYRKMALMPMEHWNKTLLQTERNILVQQGEINNEMLNTVELVERHLGNEEYDALLSRNLVFLDLYDASANNAVVECMVRNTPILVNPLEAVIEHLGPDYPFYFTSLAEAAEKAENLELVRRTHEYLVSHRKKSELSFSHFARSFAESEIYESLDALPLMNARLHRRKKG